MKTFAIAWPNNTISVVFADSTTDLFWVLDEEGDPFAPHQIAVCRTGESISSDWINGKLHITSGRDLNMQKWRAKWGGKNNPIVN